MHVYLYYWDDKIGIPSKNLQDQNQESRSAEPDFLEFHLCLSCYHITKFLHIPSYWIFGCRFFP